jgi:hypothetical protein
MTKKQVSYVRKLMRAVAKNDELSNRYAFDLNAKIDSMSQVEKIALQMALQMSKSPLSYPYLDKKINDFKQRLTHQAQMTEDELIQS